jgi:hypothetical protein
VTVGAVTPACDHASMAHEGRAEAMDVARVARQQNGLVTDEQLAAIGLSSESVRRRVAAGALVRMGSGVYAVGGTPCSWEQSALAACLDAGSAAVLSHQSAGAAWHLAVPPALPIHLTVPYGNSARSRAGGVVRHRSRALTAGERTRIGRLPVTSLTRTLVDLAATTSGEALSRIVDDALCRRLVSPARLRAAVEQHARAKRRGTRALRGVIEPWLAGAPFESVAEARFRRAIALAGLPEPVVQQVVTDGDGFVARTDLAWPDQMVVLEVDGFRWHANPDSHARDSRRSNRLAASGWTVLHATPAELEETPAAVIAALRRHLRLLA